MHIIHKRQEADEAPMGKQGGRGFFPCFKAVFLTQLPPHIEKHLHKNKTFKKNPKKHSQNTPNNSNLTEDGKTPHRTIHIREKAF